MTTTRQNIVSAAKTCLNVRVNCPKSCPLFRMKNCQKIIIREIIRMYNEMNGVDADEVESILEEEETQTEA